MEKNKFLLILHNNILLAEYQIFRRDLNNGLLSIDKALASLQSVFANSSAKELLFYQLIRIGLNNAKECIEQKRRTIGLVELRHVVNIPLIYLVKDYKKEQEDFYWLHIKPQYETCCQKELAERFERIWAEIKRLSK